MLHGKNVTYVFVRKQKSDLPKAQIAHHTEKWEAIRMVQFELNMWLPKLNGNLVKSKKCSLLLDSGCDTTEKSDFGTSNFVLTH